MTKKVRIENADTSANPIKVEIWDGTGEQDIEDHKLINIHELKYPTDMVEVTIWKGRYILIVE